MAAPCVEHVAVRVRDFEAALAFFTDVMGMVTQITGRLVSADLTSGTVVVSAA